MAVEFYFGGRRIVQPGAYATITSGGQTQPITNAYGRLLIIDTGSGAGFSGGSGVAGEFSQGKDSVYKFSELSDFQSYLNGGLNWKLAEKLFQPDQKTGAIGVSEVLYVKAAETTSASMTFTATGGGSNGGTFKFKTKDEGTCANGTLTSTHLDKGYAYTVETAPVDTNKWVLKVWRGTWKGDHTDNIAYDGIAKADTSARLIITSPEFDNIQTLIDWGTSDIAFGASFVLDETSEADGTGVVDAADIALITGYVVATGGTETFDSTNLDLALEAIEDVFYNAILIDKYGSTDYDNALVLKIKSHVLNNAKFKSQIWFGGGKDATEFNVTDGSVEIAKYHNSARFIVVHGDSGEKSTQVASGFRRWPSIYTAATVLGRTLGKQPQVPITNKTIGVDKLYHNLSKKERDIALDGGVLVLWDNSSVGSITVLEGVNSLKNNKSIKTPQGESFLISTMRIIDQINGELIVNAESTLLNDENGVNRFSLSANTVKSFTQNYLESRTATDFDNLLIAWKDVSVVKQGDAWLVNYYIDPNSEINKIFFTGFLL